MNEAIYRKMLGYCVNGYKRRTEVSSTEEAPPSPSVDDEVDAISRTFLGMAHTMKIYVKYSLYVPPFPHFFSFPPSPTSQFYSSFM